MVKDRDEDSGRYTETVSDDEIVEYVRERGGVSTTDVATEFEYERPSAYRRLKALEDEERVESRRIGNSLLWEARERHTTPPESTASPSPPEPTRRDEPPSMAGETDADDTLADDVRAYLEEHDLPPKTAHGRNVVIDVFRALREQGTMKTGDLQSEVFPDYTDRWGSERTMWNAIDRYLEDIPGIEKAGYGEWGYAGDDAVLEVLADG